LRQLILSFGTQKVLQVLSVVFLVAVIAYAPLARALDLDATYTKHNFSFKYPSQPSFDYDVGEEPAGTILGHYLFHILYVSWLTTPEIQPENVTEQINEGIASVEHFFGLSSPSLGAPDQIPVQEYSATYQRITASFNGVQVDGGIASWYCEKTTRLFTLMAVDVTDGFDLFQRYLASFDCHPESIPGFPLEAILIGLGLGLPVVIVLRRHRTAHQIERTPRPRQVAARRQP